MSKYATLLPVPVIPAAMAELREGFKRRKGDPCDTIESLAAIALEAGIECLKEIDFDVSKAIRAQVRHELGLPSERGS